MNLCGCGCGQPVRIVKGKPEPYVSGHLTQAEREQNKRRFRFEEPR